MDPQLARHADGYRLPARLERARRVHTFILEVETRKADRFSQAACMQQGREALAQAHDRFVVVHGQDFAISPQVLGASGHTLASESSRSPAEIIASQQRPATLAKVVHPAGRELLPAARALEMGDVRVRHWCVVRCPLFVVRDSLFTSGLSLGTPFPPSRAAEPLTIVKYSVLHDGSRSFSFEPLVTYNDLCASGNGQLTTDNKRHAHTTDRRRPRWHAAEQPDGGLSRQPGGSRRRGSTGSPDRRRYRPALSFGPASRGTDSLPGHPDLV